MCQAKRCEHWLEEMASWGHMALVMDRLCPAALLRFVSLPVPPRRPSQRTGRSAAVRVCCLLSSQASHYSERARCEKGLCPYIRATRSGCSFIQRRGCGPTASRGGSAAATWRTVSHLATHDRGGEASQRRGMPNVLPARVRHPHIRPQT